MEPETGSFGPSLDEISSSIGRSVSKKDIIFCRFLTIDASSSQIPIEQKVLSPFCIKTVLLIPSHLAMLLNFSIIVFYFPSFAMNLSTFEYLAI